MPSVAVALLAFVTAVPALVSSPQSRARTAERGSRAEEFDSYQIPAGTALLLELRTPFDSGSARVNDEVEAILWSPVIQNGVVLIPTDSLVNGKITAVVRASKQTPVGSVTLIMSVVQHGGTGDRAMLRTQRIVMEAPVEVAQRGRGGKKRKPADAAMAEGARFMAVMSEPLIVRIPK
jgi:hypothetical protein